MEFIPLNPKQMKTDIRFTDQNIKVITTVRLKYEIASPSADGSQ